MIREMRLPPGMTVAQHNAMTRARLDELNAEAKAELDLARAEPERKPKCT